MGPTWFVCRGSMESWWHRTPENLQLTFSFFIWTPLLPPGSGLVSALRRDREITKNFALLIMKICWTINFGKQDNCSMLFWKPLKTQWGRPKDPVTNYGSSVQATLPHTVKGLINSSVVDAFFKMVKSPTEYKVTFYDQTASQWKRWDQESRDPHCSFFLKGGFKNNLGDLLSRYFCLLVPHC